MGPSQSSQYTRVDFGPEALGSSIHTRFTSPNVKPYGRVKSRMVAERRSTDATLITQLLSDNLTMWTLVRKTARTEEPATTEAASAPKPAAESPVETAEDKIADKAEELNIEVIMAEEPATLDPTKRRLELWSQSTSTKLMIQLLPTRVCSRCFRSDSGEVSMTHFAMPWNPASKAQSSSCAQRSRREALMSQWRNARTPRNS